MMMINHDLLPRGHVISWQSGSPSVCNIGIVITSGFRGGHVRLVCSSGVGPEAEKCRLRLVIFNSHTLWAALYTRRIVQNRYSTRRQLNRETMTRRPHHELPYPS